MGKTIYNEMTATEKLKQNGVRITEKTIFVAKKVGVVGIKLWGTIEFLCNNCGYKWVTTKTR